ncbi:LptF/LptG family permease [Candidatus Sumerlaeota bacterium]|nr:LptF/LptG family permease [Candidatus Sumerlaeota bacterium]
MTILDRYILREFVKGFLLILAVFSGILLLKEILRSLTSILVDNPEAYQVVLYFINKLPGEVLEIVPVTAVLAMMFAVGSMAKRKEVLAIHASGVSYIRVARPLALATAGIALTVFVCNEVVIPRCEARARYIKKVKIDGRDESFVTQNRNITTKGMGNRFYDMKSFDGERKVMERPTITDHSEDGRTIVQRIDAAYAELVARDNEDATSAALPAKGNGSKGATTGSYWRFYDMTRRRMDEEGNMRYEFFPVHEMLLEENLDRFLATNKRPNEMNFNELRTFLRIQRRNLRGTGFLRIRTNMHEKIAFPVSVFLLGMIGYTFAVRASIRSLVMEFGLALTSVVGYYVLLAIGGKAGGAGIVPPLLGAWLANVVFGALTVWRFRALERVPRG